MRQSLSNLKYYLKTALWVLPISLYVNSYANDHQAELPSDKMFSVTNGDRGCLKGTLSNGRYTAPEGVFSCQVVDFGKEPCIVQDIFSDNFCLVGFSSLGGNFKKAQVVFLGGPEKHPLEEILKNAFYDLEMKILKTEEKAQGVVILAEEMIDTGLFFAAVSIDKIATLRDKNGKEIPSTRGYLIFKETDKLVMLSDQMTVSKEHLSHQDSVERLKKEMLDFKKTFKFGATPSFVSDEKKATIALKSFADSFSRMPNHKAVVLSSEEQQLAAEMMGLVSQYVGVTDPTNVRASSEQASLIEFSVRPEVTKGKEKTIPTPSQVQVFDSQKVFKDHIAAALSIFDVHGNHFVNSIPRTKSMSVGGKFMDKIQRIEMIYSSPVTPINEEHFAVMLSSFIQNVNSHKELFGPYLATFPVTPEEYELRVMLPHYNTLSPKENPKPSFIFNIGDTIFLCHREPDSKRLQVYKKLSFIETMQEINRKINHVLF